VQVAAKQRLGLCQTKRFNQNSGAAPTNNNHDPIGSNKQLPLGMLEQCDGDTTMRCIVKAHAHPYLITDDNCCVLKLLKQTRCNARDNISPQ